MDKVKVDLLREAFSKVPPGEWEIVLGSGRNVCTGIATHLPGAISSTMIADFLPEWFIKDNCAPLDHSPNMEFVVLVHMLMPEILTALEAQQ